MKWISFLFLSLVPMLAFAAREYASETKPKVPVDVADFGGEEESRFHFASGVYFSTGSIGTKNQTIASRTVNSAHAFLQIGHESGYITPFLIAEYGLNIQSTDSSRVSGTNMSGAGYDAGVGLRLTAGKFNFSAAYLPFGSYELTSKTTTGSTVSYSEPSIWKIGLGYSFDSLSVFLAQKFVEFSKSTTGSITVSMGDDKLSLVSTGGGIEWTF